MKKFLSFALAVLMGWGLFAQNSQPFDGNLYYEDFEQHVGWTANGDWQVDSAYGSSLIFTGYNEARSNLANELFTPTFIFNTADVANTSTGTMDFWVNCEAAGDAPVTATYQVFIIVNGGAPIALSQSAITISSEDGWTKKSIPLSGFAPVITSNNTQVQFGFLQTAISGAGYFMLDDFRIKKFENANMIMFFTPEGEYIGYDSNEEEDSAFVAPEYPLTIPSGYGFAYWDVYHYNQGTPEYLGISMWAGDRATGIDEDLLFLANFGKKLNINFNANGGIGTMNTQIVVQYTYAELNANTFTRNGYTFTGWNTRADGTGEAYSDGGTIALTEETDVTLYAQWAAGASTNITVTFNANGGVGTMNPATVQQNSAYTVPACTYTRNGYTFSTWNTAANGTGTNYAPGTTLPTSADITLYAIWNENGGGQQGGGEQGGGEQGGGEQGGGEQGGGQQGGGEQGGGEQGGGEQGGGQQGGGEQGGGEQGGGQQGGGEQGGGEQGGGQQGGGEQGGGEQGGGEQGGQTENVTITYVANGGVGTMTPSVVTKNSAYTVLACAYTREGYTFNTWNTQPDGSGVSYAPGTTLPTNADVILYAIWNQNGTNGIASVATMSVDVYPNPAVSMVTVNGANVQRIEVMDLVGRVVRSNEGINTINLSGLNKGVYMLRISAKEGMAMKRIVKE